MSWRRYGGHVKVRGDLWAGGSVYVGSSQDTAWAREAADRMYTPDALAVGGTAGFRENVAFTKNADMSGGTPLLPQSTAAPTLTVNGQVNLNQNTGAGTARLYVRTGGTTYFFNAAGTV